MQTVDSGAHRTSTSRHAACGMRLRRVLGAVGSGVCSLALYACVRFTPFDPSQTERREIPAARATAKRIAERGFIKSNTEYYVINAVLIDQGSLISADEREYLQGLADAYEEKA
ncbi:hypothetical protein GTP46_27690 [Duganella sp. FT135W]|uniref:Uncharacterized protein n=1 Tax=Duganella flavida TaxID=2692175 RepID=A0A6L8KH25_9BURK|nr:hypothetical protein [Duganella flavida]MYM26415.1 hypothetical protein [Duganella flavida]